LQSHPRVVNEPRAARSLLMNVNKSAAIPT
jgi:hypothetical protein